MGRDTLSSGAGDADSQLRLGDVRRDARLSGLADASRAEPSDDEDHTPQEEADEVVHRRRSRRVRGPPDGDKAPEVLGRRGGGSAQLRRFHLEQGLRGPVQEDDPGGGRLFYRFVAGEGKCVELNLCFSFSLF